MERGSELQVMDDDHAYVHSLEEDQLNPREWTMFDYFTRQDSGDAADLEEILAHDKLELATGDSFTSEWNVRHTLSYWGAVLFIVGSILCTWGSAWWLRYIDESTYDDPQGVVSWSFKLGSWAYTLGSYSYFFQLINLNCSESSTKFIAGPPTTNSRAYWTSAIFLAGSLMSLVRRVAPWGYYSAYGLNTGSSLCFTIGGAVSFMNNQCYKWRPYKLGWWCAHFNMYGGLLFLFPCVVAIARGEDNTAWVVMPYLIGSSLYLVSAVISLLMWKMDMFGGAMEPRLNLVLSRHKRTRKYQVYQLPFLVLYAFTACVGISYLNYALQCDVPAITMSDGLFATILPIGILALGSVIHRTPEIAPWSYLLWFLRFIMAWFTVNICIETYLVRTVQC